MAQTYGLLGYPLGHSFSRGYFTDKFAASNISAEYLNFELPSMDTYLEMLDSHPTLCGHNVTIPYKQQVMPFLNELSEEAKAIGAVNVVKVTRSADGTRHLKGFNSDVVGFVESIRPLLKPHHTHALILGTGGASKAVRYGLEEKLGIKTLFVSRTQRPSCITYSDVTPALLEQYTVIVNCTPSGMHPHVDECPPLPYSALSAKHLLFDLIYNPSQTLFMKKGTEQGATAKNGHEMLILQAEESWRIWNE